MKTLTLTNKVLLVLVALLSLTITDAQTTHIVDNNPGTSPDFTDLQVAIDAAASGDIIYLQQSSTSYGNVSITDKGLTIIGRSHSDSGYLSTISNLTLNENSSNTTLRGLNISSINESFAATLGTIENIVIADCKVSSIGFQTSNTKNNILIQGNVISDLRITGPNSGTSLITNNIFNSSSISLTGNPANTLFTNNIIRVNGGSISSNSTDTLNISNCIFISHIDFIGAQNYEIPMNGNYQVSNCLTYYYGGTSLSFATNSSAVNIVQNSLLDTDPLFTNVIPMSSSEGSIAYNTFSPTSDDLTLQAGSPAIGSGSGGVDMGIFEDYNFKNLGEPTGYPGLKIDSYSATVPKNSNLTVTIKAKTN